MTLPRILTITAGLLVVGLLWLAWPFYQFYAHRDVVPLGPFGWEPLPGDAPAEQVLHDPAYADQAAEAMAVLARHQQDLRTPAMSAAVAVDGEVVWAGTVGWADIAAREPASPKTRFRIGSTSKALTATGLARLVDAGLISLDAPLEAIHDPLPNPHWATITPRQLASHMSGMPHYKDNTDWLGLYRSVALDTRYERMTDAVTVFDGSELLFEPGTDFHYSTLGTVLLGATMGQAAGSSYREVMQEQVFEPLGMDDTIVAPPTSAGAEHMSTSYKYRDGELRPWRPVDQTHRLPGGGFASTSSDLVRLGIAWLDEDFIEPATRTRFWTPQTLANGEVNPQKYCLGWRVRDYEAGGHETVRNANHGGVSRGALSWLMVFPDYDMAIAFNTNSKTRTHDFQPFAHVWDDLFLAFAGSGAEEG